MANTISTDKSKTIREKLAEAGFPSELVEALPAELISRLDEVAEHVVVIGLDPVEEEPAERGCRHPRLAIVNHPDSPRQEPESLLGNVDLLVTMMMGYLSSTPERFASFR